MEIDKEYYLSTQEGKDYFIYKTEMFKLSEIDIINLIKICLIEARSKSIGRKILEVYKDSTEKRKKLTEERLKLIGIKEIEKQKPLKYGNAKIK